MFDGLKYRKCKKNLVFCTKFDRTEAKQLNNTRKTHKLWSNNIQYDETDDYHKKWDMFQVDSNLYFDKAITFSNKVL